MGKVNCLSKRLDQKVGIENNNKNQKKVKEKDKEIVRVVEKMKKAEVKVLRGDKWQIKGELVLKKRKFYVLKSKELKVKIIWLYCI